MWYIDLIEYKDEWSTDSRCKMNELRKHYTKWKKPITKEYILQDPIYMKHLDFANYMDTKKEKPGIF